MMNSSPQQIFRNAMAACAAGIHVITTDGPAGRYGITMTAVAPITDEPPTVMLCINRSAHILPILQQNRGLCINVLSSSQQDVAEHFAGMTALSPEERFEYHIWHRGQSGQWQVEGALAHLHCTIEQEHTVGTHQVLYVSVNEILMGLSVTEETPALVYFRRNFMSLP